MDGLSGIGMVAVGLCIELLLWVDMTCVFHFRADASARTHLRAPARLTTRLSL
jgi:hypothetical protein